MNFANAINNIGAAAVNLGHHGWAMKLFKTALDEKVKELSGDQAQNTGDVVASYEQEFYLRQLNTLLSFSSNGESEMNATKKASVGWNGSLFIYQRALPVPLTTLVTPSTRNTGTAKQRQNGDADDSDEDHADRYHHYRHLNPIVESTSQASVVILYNLGLVHHLHAAETGFQNCCSLSAEKAIKFYGMALELLREVYGSGDDGRFKSSVLGTPTLALIAILNNLGQLYYELGQVEVGRDFFTQLSNVLLMSIVCNERNEYFDNADWEGMILNAAVSLNSVQYAPAA